MDGFEVCHRVKTSAATKRVKILAITGFATEENIRKILHAGADDYLPKPLRIQELNEKIEQLLGAKD
jgi:DNA-binding response OmpR family regulator